jgi:hypothetical protein
MVGKPEFGQSVSSLIHLRTIVAALGERTSPPWWRTQFLSNVGLRTIGRIFPRTAIRAALESTCIVARADHDRRIGVGRAYHLFRLPTSLEGALSTLTMDDQFCAEVTAMLAQPKEDLVRSLSTITNSRKAEAVEGPIRLGLAERLLEPAGLEEMASHYRSSLEIGRRVFPYFESEER